DGGDQACQRTGQAAQVADAPPPSQAIRTVTVRAMADTMACPSMARTAAGSDPASSAAGRLVSTERTGAPMNDSKTGRWTRAAGALAAAALLALSGPALATEQAQQRQDGRDAKQDAKQQ